MNLDSTYWQLVAMTSIGIAVITGSVVVFMGHHVDDFAIGCKRFAIITFMLAAVKSFAVATGDSIVLHEQAAITSVFWLWGLGGGFWFGGTWSIARRQHSLN